MSEGVCVAGGRSVCIYDFPYIFFKDGLLVWCYDSRLVQELPTWTIKKMAPVHGTGKLGVGT